MTAIKSGLRRALVLGLLLSFGPVLAATAGLAQLGADWRTASRAPAGIAPDPATTPEPVLQVYGARAFNWRGAFAVHTWIALKRKGAPAFTTYEVVGWHVRHGGSALARHEGAPDRRWYGARPELYLDLRGPEVEALIGQVEAAIAAYPYKDTYRTWPGPNSNTFTAYLGRSVPALGLELPPTAIGKDYLGWPTLAARSPSGTGYQVSLFGIFGLLGGLREGIEVNLLGLVFGIDFAEPALKLPGLGRLAWPIGA